MDFSMINDPLSNSRNIKVILSENGSLHEYSANKFISPIGSKKGAFLADLLQKDHFIKKENQLVLREDDGEQMEANTNLEQFFQKDLTVYLYVINEERKKEVHEEFEVIDSVIKKWSESIMQFLPSQFQSTLGSNVRDFLDSTSASQYDELISVFSDTKNEISLIKDGNIKLQRQKTAEGVAKKNFLNFYNERKKKCNEKLGEIEQQLDLFQQYLSNFDQYIDLLSKKSIAPQLGETDRKNLVDYFNIEKLREFKKNSEINLGKITLKGQKIKEEIVEYGNELQNFHCGVTDNSTDVFNLLREEENIFVDIEGQTIQGFQNLVEEKKRNPTQKDLCDFVKREYENSLPKLREIYDRIVNIRNDLETQLAENGTKLQELVNFLLKLKHIMKGKLQTKIKLFSTVVENQSEEIFNIEIIEKFPMIYEQSLNEIKRRTNFKKDFFAVLKVLEGLGDSENKKRREFLEKYQQYLPKSFCPFLSKSFSQLNFEHIKKLIDQDIVVEYEDSDEVSSDKVLTKLIEKLENDREFENQKKDFENMITALKKENEDLQNRVSQNNVEKIKDLFIASNFSDLTERMEEFKNSIGASLEKQMGRVDKLKEVKARLEEALEAKNLAQQESRDLALENKKLAQQSETEFKQKIESLQKMLEEMEADCKLRLESLQKLVLEKEKIASEKENQLKAKVAEFEKEKKELQNNLGDKSQIEQRVDALSQEKKALEQQIATLNQEKKAFEQQIATITQEKKGCEQQIASLNQEKKAFEQQIASLTQEKKASEQHVLALQQEMATLGKKTEEATKKLKTSETKQKESDAKHKAIVAQCEAQVKAVDSLKVENAELLAKNKVQEVTVTTMKETVKNLEEKIQDLVKGNEGKESAVNSEIERLQNLNQYLTEQLDSANESVVDQMKLKEEVQQLNVMVKRKEEINEENARLIQEYQVEIEELRANILKGSVMKTNVLDATEKMMAEIGEKIVMLYTAVVGQDDKLSAREHDLVEILDAILRNIQEKMATYSDFVPKSRIFAVRVNQSEKDYVLIQKDFGLNMVYFFRADENYGDIITGVIDAFGDPHYGDAVAASFNVEVAVEVKLNAVEKICNFVSLQNQAA